MLGLRGTIITALLFTLSASTAIVHAQSQETVATYSEKHPQITSIASYRDKIYFAGRWQDQAIVVRREKGDRFSTYSSRIGGQVSEVTYDHGTEKGFLFEDHAGSKALFSFSQNRWIPVPHDTTLKAISTPRTNYTTHDNTLFLNDNPKRKFRFPPPDRATFWKWTGVPAPMSELKAAIGQTCQIGRDIWFLIDYYDGEGQNGIGGLGLFDTVSRRFGVIRDPLLARCSKGTMLRKGDTLFILTASLYESGTSADKGLVVVDLKNMRISDIDTSPPMDGNRFTAGAVIGNSLWMATSNSIVRWNLDSDEWSSARVETVRTKGRIGLYVDRMAKVYDADRPSHYGLIRLDTLIQRESTPDSAELEYYWGESTYNQKTMEFHHFIEVQAAEPLTGWVRESDLNMLDTLGPDDRASGYPVSIYSDSSLTRPLSTFKFGAFKKLKHQAKEVEISVNSLWAKPDSLIPLFTTQSREWFTPKWRHFDRKHGTMEQMAFATFDSETVAPPDSFLAYDTVLVCRSGIDPYKEYHGLIYGTWLPEPDSPQPTGLALGIGDFDFSPTITLRDGKVYVYGKEASRGYTWQINTSEYTATFKLTGYAVQPVHPDAFQRIVIKYTLWVLNPHNDGQ